MGWADVATKRDLDALEERMELRFEVVDERITSLEHKLTATFRGELVNQTRTMVYANLAAVFTGVSLAFVAARLT